MDLVGFPALAESERDGRAIEVVRGLHRRVRALLAEHRAEQVKALGDGVMLRQAAGGLGRVAWGRRELHWLRNVSEPMPALLASELELPARAPVQRHGWRAVRLRSWTCPKARHARA